MVSAPIDKAASMFISRQFYQLCAGALLAGIAEGADVKFVELLHIRTPMIMDITASGQVSPGS